LASAVAAFTPHPYRVLGRADYIPLFTRWERADLLERQGVDYLLEYPFDEALILLPPVAFGRIIFERLRAHTVVIGEGYRFGYNREGTIQSLQTLAEQYGRTLEIIQNHESISTSSIRALLGGESNYDAPRFKEAAGLLGFPFFVMGEVIPGRRLGRDLGFPTLNLYPPPDKYLPRYGVYATRTLIKGRAFCGITNVGLRPTVDADETVPTVETHLFDFNGDMYGQEIRVEFLHFLRAERRFQNLDELRAQISADIREAVSFFA
jgi:riboflavin kinase/FMN adenylyltransferase